MLNLGHLVFEKVFRKRFRETRDPEEMRFDDFEVDAGRNLSVVLVESGFFDLHVNRLVAQAVFEHKGCAVWRLDLRAKAFDVSDDIVDGCFHVPVYDELSTFYMRLQAVEEFAASCSGFDHRKLELTRPA